MHGALICTLFSIYFTWPFPVTLLRVYHVEYLNNARICTLSSVTLSGHVKYRRNPSACKIAEDSACDVHPHNYIGELIR